MEIPSHFIYFTYDGDSVGRKIGRATMANDLDELVNISERIKTGHELVKRWVKENDGIWINGGGDEGLAAIPKECVDGLKQFRKDYEYLVGHTISVGVGKEPSESGRALLIAKLKGKNQIVTFSEATEKEILKIKKRAKKGAFKSMEEHKLAEAYLKKSEESCPYCEQTDGIDPNHCKFCHDEEVQGDAEPCPYCQDDAAGGQKMREMGEQDCQYCKEMDQNAQESCPYCQGPENSNASPDSANDVAVAGSDAEKDQYDKMGMNPPIIGKPRPGENLPPGQNAPMDTEPVLDVAAEMRDPERSPTAAIDPEDNHSKDALTSIAQQIEAEGNPTEKQVNAVDDSEVSNGTEMEGNASRPEGFGQSTPGDMGLGGPNAPEHGEEEPDLTSVLEEGLDQHADAAQREKVIQMTSQALQQFKGCKDILENIKGQSPQLYQASISMLKAMIEMASLLGLGQGLGQNTELGQEQAELVPAQEENEWHEVFPAHPDNGGAEQKPGHAPPKSAKEDGAPSPQP